jgi:RHS repeat-associated protein
VLRTYDGENRMTKEVQANSYVAGSYSYNADGQRVRRTAGGVETWQIYGVGGELLAEYAKDGAPASPQKEYGYRNGQLLVQVTAAATGGAAPVFSDNPLVPHVTPVYATHITELRTAIDQLRASMGLAAANWVQPVSTAVYINAAPIQELRVKLDEAIGPPTIAYTADLATGKPILAAHIQELRNRVISAQATQTALSIEWLVTDQLGTPRMILDQTGSLANVRRHDYLPFGEELLSSTGVRSTVPGYVGSDVRQKFTQKERDVETGLVYFLARYYSSTQGRFTSPDEFKGGPDELYDFAENASNNPLFYGDLTNPQSLNKYQYAYNNPLRYVDPDGHDADELEPQQQGDRTRPTNGPIYGPPSLAPDIPATIQAIKQLWDAINEAGRPTRELIGTEEAPTIEPLPNPTQQFQPMPPPPPAQAENAERSNGKRNITVTHPNRKAAKEAAEHPHPGKKLPTPGKDATKAKRDAYKEQQKYRYSEANPNSKHPERHFHDRNKSRAKVNRHNVY